MFIFWVTFEFSMQSSGSPYPLQTSTITSLWYAKL